MIRGFDRDARWKNLGLPVVLPAALARGYSIVRRFRPDVVLGVGGYAMVPSVAAARKVNSSFILTRVAARTYGFTAAEYGPRGARAR